MVIWGKDEEKKVENANQEKKEESSPRTLTLLEKVNRAIRVKREQDEGKPKLSNRETMQVFVAVIRGLGGICRYVEKLFPLSPKPPPAVAPGMVL